MTSTQQFFQLRGGLDQETPAITIPPGRAIAAMNHESTALGYKRTDGYERFDGRAAPSRAVFATLEFTEGAVAFAVGEIITGYTTGATFRVLAEAVLTSGSFAGGDAAGVLPVHLVNGEFEVSELLRANDTTYARVQSVPIEGDYREGADKLAWFTASVEYARSLITAVPGSGPVRGVLWFADKLNAWRDNEDGTAGTVHESSADGWQQLDLGHIVSFTAGGPYEPQPGDTITGDETGASATVRGVYVDKGDFVDGDAQGVMVLDDVVGTLLDEPVSVGVNTSIATIGTAPEAVTIPPGGRYDFTIFNFYANPTTLRAYGANGVGKGFEFDGQTVSFITTGSVEDKPFLVEAYRNHLFFALPYGSVQNSRTGEPRMFDGRLGAAELGMGAEITNLIPNTASMMLITTSRGLSVLSGHDSSDFMLEPISEDAGAKAHTAQRIGDVVYLDNRGVRSVGSTQTFGNFKIGTYTRMINRELANKREAGIEPVASCVVKSKDQYLLFFSDGSGISIYFGTKQPEAMPFVYPFVVSCLNVAEVDGVERVFVGATNGFVYELNVGTSFDGEIIEAYLQLAFGHQGAPRIQKRYHKIECEMQASPGTQLGLITQFDNGGPEQMFTDDALADIGGGGGLWGLVTWGDFIWSAPQLADTDFWIDGAGVNMSPILVSRQSTVPSYTIAGLTVVFSPRGQKR